MQMAIHRKHLHAVSMSAIALDQEELKFITFDLRKAKLYDLPYNKGSS